MLIDINFQDKFIEECRLRMKEHCTPEDFEKYAPKSFDEMFIKIDTGIYYTSLNFDHTIEMFSDNKIKDK